MHSRFKWLTHKQVFLSTLSPSQTLTACFPSDSRLFSRQCLCFPTYRKSQKLRQREWLLIVTALLLTETLRPGRCLCHIAWLFPVRSNLTSFHSSEWSLAHLEKRCVGLCEDTRKWLSCVRQQCTSWAHLVFYSLMGSKGKWSLFTFSFLLLVED